MHTSTYYCYKRAHCEIWDCCAVVFVQQVYCTRYIGSIISEVTVKWGMWTRRSSLGLLSWYAIIKSNYYYSFEDRALHDDVIKWKHFPRYWPFVRGIHRSPVNSPHKGQWRGALMFSLICVWINGQVNNREACDLRRYPAHYDVTVMVDFMYGNPIFKWITETWLHDCRCQNDSVSNWFQATYP